MRPVRLLVVGRGRWARNYAQAAHDAGNAEVAAVVSSSKPEDVPWGSVDAVVYASHPSAAPAWVVAASCRGLPILVEKPAGLTLAEARLIDAAEDASRGVFVLVGHQHLFATGYLALRALARGGSGGLLARFSGPVERDYPARVDYGAHAVACLIGIDGAPDEVTDPALLIDPVTGGWERRPSGARVRYFAGISAERCAWVSAEDGGVRLLYDGYESSHEPPLTLEVRAFADAARAGGTDDWRFGARWAVDVARVLERHRRDFLDDPTGRP